MTKDELQYLTALCKSEVDSLGRIVAGILQVLKLEGSVGLAGMHQLSNLSMLLKSCVHFLILNGHVGITKDEVVVYLTSHAILCLYLIEQSCFFIQVVRALTKYLAQLSSVMVTIQ